MQVVLKGDVLCPLHGFGQSWLELCRISFAICMVLVNRGYNCEGCPMPIAWFGSGVLVQDVRCHLHGFGPVVVTIVQDALCDLHGFGQSWPELCRMSYAIGMVLASRGWRDILCHLYGFGWSWLDFLWISYAICMVLFSRG